MGAPLFVSERSKPEVTTRSISVGFLIFEQMDQIDFTGPFEVLSRMPDSTIQIIGKEVAPVRDVQGLRLSPDISIAEAGIFDVLVVPGGYGQQALMHDEEVLELIRRHVQSGKLLLSVCTGALFVWRCGYTRGKTGHHSLECAPFDAALRSCCCRRKGRRRWQPYQRRRCDGRAGCVPGARLPPSRRCSCAGNSAFLGVCTEPHLQ